jgi:hypothetical protein
MDRKSHPPVGQRLRHGKPEPPPGTGYQGDPAMQLH